MSERWYKRVPWLKILRVVGICCGAAIAAIGIYQLVVDDPSFKSEQSMQHTAGSSA